MALREIVEHGAVVALVPLDREGRVVLVRQFRLAARDVLLELPAGGVESGESIEEAAQRELREETGYQAGNFLRLGGFFVSPGYTTEFIHVFLARDLTEAALDSDPDEDIVVERMGLGEALSLIDSGRIQDAKSIAGLLLAARFREGARGS